MCKFWFEECLDTVILISSIYIVLLVRSALADVTLCWQTAPQPVFLVAATCQPTQVSPKLRSPGRLERELMVPLPDVLQRERIFQQLMSAHHHDLTDEAITSIAKKAYGFSGADLSVLVRCAWLACVKRTKEKVQFTKSCLLFSLNVRIFSFGYFI